MSHLKGNRSKAWYIWCIIWHCSS